MSKLNRSPPSHARDSTEAIGVGSISRTLEASLFSLRASATVLGRAYPEASRRVLGEQPTLPGMAECYHSSYSRTTAFCFRLLRRAYFLGEAGPVGVNAWEVLE